MQEHSRKVNAKCTAQNISCKLAVAESDPLSIWAVKVSDAHPLQIIVAANVSEEHACFTHALLIGAVRAAPAARFDAHDQVLGHGKPTLALNSVI